MRIALIQLNPTVGDLDANARHAARAANDAREQGADLILLPELVLCGYPPRDLLSQQGFLADAKDAALRLAEHAPQGATLVLGAPWRPPHPHDPDADPADFHTSAPLTNSLLVIRDARITHRYDKRLLPTYDVFDEHRYFTPGSRAVVIDVAGVPVGLSVCEDLWKGVDVGPEVTSYDRYEREPDPVAALVQAGARLVLNPSGSPFVLGKRKRQRDIVTRHVRRHALAIATVNQVGANDDLVFDGHAALFVPTAPPGSDAPAKLVAAAPGFNEHTLLIDLPDDPDAWPHLPPVDDPLLTTDPLEELFSALKLGVHDYITKTGHARAIVGVSGGIDSALTATIAAAALGPDNVLAIAMPSRHSSDHSLTDAEALAHNLGLPYREVPIESPHAALEALLSPAFASLDLPTNTDVTDENVQSRIRGLILMAFSNKSGALLLTTGNKSELAVGYCTLYGDMNGGLAVLSDVSKIQVYNLSRWINTNHARLGFPKPPIPDSTITKPPSAELRPNQLDADSLPPYETLDEIIERYVEQRQHPRAIVEETGFDPATVARIVRLIDVNEHKRKQMPIGLKVSSIAFGRGRRRPLAQNYRPDKTLS